MFFFFLFVLGSIGYGYGGQRVLGYVPHGEASCVERLRIEKKVAPD